MKYLDFAQFVLSYLATAAWVTADSDENNEFTEDAKLTAKNDCATFIALVILEFGAEEARPLLTTAGKDLTYLAPHDFFLTRNGHGAGFWDSPEKYGGQENADRLTAICERMGCADVYHIGEYNQSQLTF